MAKTKTVERGRDAGDGKFIKIEEAKRRPKTTVIEKVPVRKPNKK
jgi:hypothetical protein